MKGKGTRGKEKLIVNGILREGKWKERGREIECEGYFKGRGVKGKGTKGEEKLNMKGIVREGEWKKRGFKWKGQL